MNINRLEIFTSKGYKVPTQSTKAVRFTIIGNMYRTHRNYGWREDAAGYFVTDENSKIVSSVIETPGSTYSFDPQTWNTNIDYYDATLKLIDEVLVTVTVNEKEYSKSFTNNDNEENIAKYFDIATGMKKEFVRAQSSIEKDNAVYTFFIEHIFPKSPETFLVDTFGEDLEADGVSVDDLYPSNQFLGSIELERMSVGLAGVETLFILEKQDDGTYKRPKSSDQILRLEVATNSNVKFVKFADEFVNEDLTGKEYDIETIDYSKVYWSNYKAFDLVGESQDTSKDNEPLVVTIGFLCEEEGCYQDLVSFYSVDNVTNPDKSLVKNTIGFLAVQSEAIGEDERYRTLFANFGIPDPKEYQEVFKDMSVHEEGLDWDFINKKSKQLFLSYSQIFPYVGTYKALINAVKFLGYDDIYFKEWFMHFDGNFESKVSFESLDVSTGMTLQSKLKRAGVSLEDFIEWKKLNQLSLVYKINEEDDESDDVEYWRKTSSGDWESGTMRYEIPSTKAVYSYLNLEVLAKLFSLKEWLEKYILNVNCQIIDVTGEGVYFYRTRELGYSVGYETFTEEKEEHLSPVFELSASSLTLSDGESTIDCTLKEIQDGMTFADLSDKKIKTYINKIFEAFDDSSLNEMKKDDWYDVSVVGFPPEEYCLIGKPVSISIPFEELQYELTVDTSCGTMKNGVGRWETNEEGEEVFEEIPLLVLDNEMYVYKNRVNGIEFTEPPIIRVKNGSLRKPFGPWKSNTKYTIQTYFDTRARHTKYSFQSEETGFHKEYNDYVTFYPRYVKDGDTKKWVSKLKYTSDNKYNVPMLIMENYDTYDQFFMEEKKSELVKRYLDASVAISNDFDTASYATDEELENVTTKRNLLHQEAIDVWQDDLNQFKTQYESKEYIEGFNKYILMLNEGFIEGKEITRDKDVEHTVKVVFEPEYSASGGEQKIYTEYVYRSKMCPSIEFDSSLYESRYQEIKDSYKRKLEDLDLLIDDASNFRGAIVEDSEYQYAIKAANEQASYYNDKAQEREREKQAYITAYNTSSGKGKALEEYLNWMISQNSSSESRYSSLANITYDDLENKLVTIKHRFLEEYASQKDKAYTDMLRELELLKDECFSFYKDKAFTVNHLGDYTLTVKGVDGYNAPFASKSNSKARVTGMFPTIYMLDSNTKSSDGTVPVEALKIGEDPTLWPSYRRPISKTGITDSSIEYLNWSYLLDTPKDGDFLKIANLTERVNKIINTNSSTTSQEERLDSEQIKIVLNDENPQHQNLFYTGALVKLLYIDRNTNELVDSDEQISGPFIVSKYQSIPDNDIQEDDNNYIILDYSSNYEEFRGISQDTIKDVNSKAIDCYAILVSRIEIGIDNIENDYTTKTAKIKIRDSKNFNNLAFKPEQCVKIEFAQMTYVGDTPSPTNPDEKQEIVSEKYTSGTTYRVKDAWYDTNDFCEVYVLDGLVNTDLLIPEIYYNNIYNFLSDTPKENIKNMPYKVRCSISPAHTTYTSYVIQATQDADEREDTGWLTYKDNWFGKDFIDNTFSYTISKFNIYDAYRDWFKETSTKSFFSHRNPVTNNVGNNMVLMSADEAGTYKDSGYLSVWDVYVNQGKDKEDEILAYQVTNDNVPITLNYEGEYHFVLTSIDMWGNRLINKSGGYLKTLQA